MIIIGNRNGYELHEYKTDLLRILRNAKHLVKNSNGKYIFTVDDIKQRIKLLKSIHIDEVSDIIVDSKRNISKPAYWDKKIMKWIVIDKNHQPDDGNRRYSDSKSVFNNSVKLLHDSLDDLHKRGKISDNKYQRWMEHATPVMSGKLKEFVDRQKFVKNLQNL